MTLKQYFKRYPEMTMWDFCKLHGLHYVYMRHLKEHRARPSADMAERIEKATKGKVDRLELLYPNAVW